MGDPDPAREDEDVEAAQARLDRAWDEVVAATRARNEARAQRRARKLAERQARD